MLNTSLQSSIAAVLIVSASLSINIDIQAMLLWLILPFYDFCCCRSVAVSNVYKLQLFYLYIHACLEATREHVLLAALLSFSSCLSSPSHSPSSTLHAVRAGQLLQSNQIKLQYRLSNLNHTNQFKNMTAVREYGCCISHWPK